MPTFVNDAFDYNPKPKSKHSDQPKAKQIGDLWHKFPDTNKLAKLANLEKINRPKKRQ